MTLEIDGSKTTDVDDFVINNNFGQTEMERILDMRVGDVIRLGGKPVKRIE